MSRSKAVILGAGAMGRVAVKDLADLHGFDEVLVADMDAHRARAVVDEATSLPNRQGAGRMDAISVDVRNTAELHSLLDGAAVVLNATQHYFNLSVMEACLSAGCHYCDLGGLFWTTREQLALHDRFAARHLTAVLGIGSTPGITNVMAAAGAERMGEIHGIAIRSGGRDPLGGFQAPYSINTILDELTLEPMVETDGEVRSVPPMSGQETIRFRDPVGDVLCVSTLHSELASLPESYRTRGVREVSFKVGFPTRFMEQLMFLVELGFHRTEPIRVGGAQVEPRSFLSALLASQPVPARAMDWDALDVTVTGAERGEPTCLLYQTLVPPSERWNEGGGAVQTATPMAIAARMLATGDIDKPGVYPPELVLPPQPFFEALAQRGVDVTVRPC